LQGACLGLVKLVVSELVGVLPLGIVHEGAAPAALPEKELVFQPVKLACKKGQCLQNG